MEAAAEAGLLILSLLLLLRAWGQELAKWCLVVSARKDDDEMWEAMPRS